MDAWANMGHPSKEEGFVLCSNFRAADGPHAVVNKSALKELKAPY
jgi:hypothetical protein